MLITRILSLVPQVNFAQTEANMVPSIQVQILLTGVMIVQIFIAVLKQTKLFKVNNKQKIDRAKRDKTLSAVDLNNADAL
ncbi:MAG: hypothetical protein EZS28_009603 [Streblomastix strix]|uniref:Uncharacterized protein n=1 Tax=Streblomastix strix TaxID=222440 RepID=A0A5J4WIP3_9EUKA|nr:MAG: hypothetical protein EZS28_009603 [Streblomastix strix]